LPLLHHDGRAHHGEILTRIASMVEHSKLGVLIDKSNYKIADIAEAHAKQEAGENIGKIVLEV
jgi:NADPH2:quinone reductase